MNKKSNTQRKSKSIQIRVTENEKQQLSIKAKEAKKTIAGYMLDSSLNTICPREITEWVRETTQINDLYHLIKKEGTEEMKKQADEILKKRRSKK